MEKQDNKIDENFELEFANDAAILFTRYNLNEVVPYLKKINKYIEVINNHPEINFSNSTYAFMSIFVGAGILTKKNETKGLYYRSLIKEIDGYQFFYFGKKDVDKRKEEYECLISLFDDDEFTFFTAFNFLYRKKDHEEEAFIKGYDKYSTSDYYRLIEIKVILNYALYFINKNGDNSFSLNEDIIENYPYFHYVFNNEGKEGKIYLWNMIVFKYLNNKESVDRFLNTLRKKKNNFNKEELSFIYEVINSQSFFLNRGDRNVRYLLDRYISSPIFIDKDISLESEYNHEIEKYGIYYSILYKNEYIGFVIIFINEEGYSNKIDFWKFLSKEEVEKLKTNKGEKNSSFLDSTFKEIENIILKTLKTIDIYFERRSMMLGSNHDLTKISFADDLKINNWWC